MIQNLPGVGRTVIPGRPQKTNNSKKASRPFPYGTIDFQVNIDDSTSVNMTYSLIGGGFRTAVYVHNFLDGVTGMQYDKVRRIPPESGQTGGVYFNAVLRPTQTEIDV